MFGFVNGAISVPHTFDDRYFPALSSLAHTLFAECEVLIYHWFFIDKYFLLPSIWRLDLLDRLDQIQIHQRTQHPMILRLIQAPRWTLMISDDMFRVAMHGDQHPL